MRTARHAILWRVMDRTLRQTRYLRDALPVRLGGLAANLSRIASFSRHIDNRDAVLGLLDESKHFIEWTAWEASIDTAAQLVELQIQLARWQRNLSQLWPDPEKRQAMGEQAQVWSERVLKLSGLFG